MTRLILPPGVKAASAVDPELEFAKELIAWVVSRSQELQLPPAYTINVLCQVACNIIIQGIKDAPAQDSPEWQPWARRNLSHLVNGMVRTLRIVATEDEKKAFAMASPQGHEAGHG